MQHSEFKHYCHTSFNAFYHHQKVSSSNEIITKTNKKINKISKCDVDTYLEKVFCS